MEKSKFDIKELAFEGINVFFNFINEKPKFGDVFLINGFEHPKFRAERNDFECLAEFEFEQVDDFFGVPNDTEIGDDVKIWLFPIINGKEAYHSEGPFDSIKLTYDILRNSENVEDLFKAVFNKIKNEVEFKTEIIFEDEKIDSFEVLEPIIKKVKNYCKSKLNVELGSDEALKLDY